MNAEERQVIKAAREWARVYHTVVDYSVEGASVRRALSSAVLNLPEEPKLTATETALVAWAQEVKASPEPLTRLRPTTIELYKEALKLFPVDLKEKVVEAAQAWYKKFHPNLNRCRRNNSDECYDLGVAVRDLNDE